MLKIRAFILKIGIQDLNLRSMPKITVFPSSISLLLRIKTIANPLFGIEEAATLPNWSIV
jgi:hypothetical protein